MKTALKMILTLLFCFTLCLLLVPAAFAGTIDSGTCGENNGEPYWTLYDNGELVISGSGPMAMSDNIPWNDYRSELLSVTIEEGVTEIWWNSFMDCRRLTSVTIPASLEAIRGWGFGYNPFEGCFALQNITVNKENKSYCDVDGVLFTKDMTGLFSFPAGRSGDYSIPSGVLFTSQKAFFGCRGLTSVTIPASLTWIGSGAFAGCVGLQNITVNKENKSYCVIDGVLYDLYSDGDSSLHTFPAGRSGDYSIPSGVKEIGLWSFYGCKGLTSVTIPVSVEFVGLEAFTGCELKAAYYQGTRNQWSEVDVGEGNDALTSKLIYLENTAGLFLPEELTTIEEEAFAGGAFICVVLPDSCEKIEPYAFADCQKLKYIIIPNDRAEIDQNAFGDKTGLTIYGYRGSTAEAYAVVHGFDFVNMTSTLAPPIIVPFS